MSDVTVSAQPQASAASEAPVSTDVQAVEAQSTEAPESNEISTEELEALAADEESSGSSEQPNSKEAKKEIKKASDKEVEAAKQSLKRKYKLKVDGEELDAELSDEEVARELQLARKARKEIQSAAEVKKEAELLVKLMKEDPSRVLAHEAFLGSHEEVLKFAQKILEKELEEQSKDPAIREKEQLQKELEELREQTKKDKESREAEEYQRLVKAAEADLEEKVSEAIDTSGLPKSPYVLKKLADVMISSMELSGKEITPKQAMNIVKKEMLKDIKDLFDASPDDVLEELIGNNNVKRLSKTRLAKVRKAVPTASTIKSTGETYEAPKPVKQMSVKDFLKNGFGE